MIRPTTASAAFATALFATAALSAPTDAQTSTFRNACFPKITSVANDLKVCAVGVVTDKEHVRVLVSTSPTMVGKTVSVYSNPMQAAQEPDLLPEFTTMKGRMVVIGGHGTTSSVWSAKVL